MTSRDVSAAWLSFYTGALRLNRYIPSLKHAFADTADPRIQIAAVSEGERIIIRIQPEGEYGYTLVAGTEFSMEIPVDDVSRDVGRKESNL